MTTFDIELPKEITPPDSINCKTMIVYGLPKSGKTTLVSELEDCLIIDIEKGSGFVSGKKMIVPDGLTPLQEAQWIIAVANKIKAEGKPYKYVAIDSTTRLDEIAEWTGTERYMASSQGKDWNRFNKKDQPNDSKLWGQVIPLDHPDYQSIHTQGQGYGYRWSRGEMQNFWNVLHDLGSVCTIFICHVADKAVVSKVSNFEVSSRDLALTGKVKDIFARKVDATGYIYHEDGKTMISFKGNEERNGGIRAAHVRGYEGPADWKKIFI